ncbi:hypothetical protein AAHA92_15785 [Salvia divinorum]|uniref:Secreted protein n=1 Tax=Salvia divinorum TaxID=28513 RepID=A0ABD1HGP2_SALDI
MHRTIAELPLSSWCPGAALFILCLLNQPLTFAVAAESGPDCRPLRRNRRCVAARPATVACCRSDSPNPSPKGR